MWEGVPQCKWALQHNADDTSILFCSSLVPSPYFHSTFCLEGEIGPGDIGPLRR